MSVYSIMTGKGGNGYRCFLGGGSERQQSAAHERRITWLDREWNNTAHRANPGNSEGSGRRGRRRAKQVQLQDARKAWALGQTRNVAQQVRYNHFAIYSRARLGGAGEYSWSRPRSGLYWRSQLGLWLFGCDHFKQTTYLVTSCRLAGALFRKGIPARCGTCPGNIVRPFQSVRL
jgi:hypothetical protein